MSLSISKLEKLLSRSGIIPKKYFTMDGACVYIETLILQTADVLLLYIPSKYEIRIPNAQNSFELTSVEVNEDGTIPGDYGGSGDDLEVGQRYESVDLDISTLKENGENIEDQLKRHYDQPFALKDVSQVDMSRLRETFRQLKRLKLCVQTLKYKLCITFKNYLCCIRRDNLFDGFLIKGPPSSGDYRLRVSIDLESLYFKLGSITMDVKTVRQGIYKVLDKNHLRHANSFKKILENKANLVQTAKLSSDKRTQYVSYLARLDKMLEELAKAENEEKECIDIADQKYPSEATVKGLQRDITKSHLIAKHQEQLASINMVRQDVIRQSLKVKSALEDLSLRMDKACFDNIVMLDAILKNLVEMADF